MKSWSDEEIVFCLQDGGIKKDDALKQLYQQLFPVIKSFVLKNNGTADDAADIFQDAIIVFYEKVRLREFELTSSIKTYLYSVCRHLWLNKLRRLKKVSSLSEEYDSISIDPSSLQVIGTKEKNEYLKKLMGSIGKDCKAILIYYYFDRLKMKQIAEKMNFANDQVAKNKKSSCLKKLKSIVSDSPELREILK